MGRTERRQRQRPKGGTGTHSRGPSLILPELPLFWGLLPKGRGAGHPPVRDPGPSQGTSGWTHPCQCVAWRHWVGGLEPEGGRGPGRPGPASLPAHEPHGCPALCPASLNNASQTKSLFLLVLNPQPLPSLPSAKIKTSNRRLLFGADRGTGGGQHDVGRGGTGHPTDLAGPGSKGNTHLTLGPRRQASRGRGQTGPQSPQ